MIEPRRLRLDPDVFRLPVERIRDGYYTDAYFNLTKELLEANGRHPRVVMQVFQKRHSVLGGIDEAIAVLKLCAGRRVDGEWQLGWDDLEVRALHEGDEISPYESIMHIEGDYSLFAHLETVYLGSLARRTLIMRNVHEVVEAARGKQIFYFPARHDHWLVQTGDGWAAHVAGAIGVSTDAQASWWGGRGMGTVPTPSRWRSPSAPTSTTTPWERPSRSPTRSATGCGGCGSTRATRSSTARCGRRWATSGRPA